MARPFKKLGEPNEPVMRAVRATDVSQVRKVLLPSSPRTAEGDGTIGLPGTGPEGITTGPRPSLFGESGPGKPDSGDRELKPVEVSEAGFRKLLFQVLAEPAQDSETPMTNLEKVVRILVQAAVKKDATALEMIFDRVAGKPSRGQTVSTQESSIDDQLDEQTTKLLNQFAQGPKP
jgi:hypothetical protein